MKVNQPDIVELAALQAIGALDGGDAPLFGQLLAESPAARGELAGMQRVTESLARSLPRTCRPSADLRGRIVRRAEQSLARRHVEAQLFQLAPAATAGFAYLHGASGGDWMPLPVPGAFVRLLSYDRQNEYATVLGKLEAGASYPAHVHKHPEDVFMISGDLHIGADKVIKAGDFHHAEAGTRHDVNWSEQGCVLLAVLSKEDLLAQVVPA